MLSYYGNAWVLLTSSKACDWSGKIFGASPQQKNWLRMYVTLFHCCSITVRIKKCEVRDIRVACGMFGWRWSGHIFGASPQQKNWLRMYVTLFHCCSITVRIKKCEVRDIRVACGMFGWRNLGWYAWPKQLVWCLNYLVQVRSLVGCLLFIPNSVGLEKYKHCSETD